MSNLGIKADIERLSLEGKGPTFISQQVGCTPAYASYVINLLGRSPTPKPDRTSNDDKHLRLIAAANKGRGFPVCVVLPPQSTPRGHFGKPRTGVESRS